MGRFVSVLLGCLLAVGGLGLLGHALAGGLPLGAGGSDAAIVALRSDDDDDHDDDDNDDDGSGRGRGRGRGRGGDDDEDATAAAGAVATPEGAVVVQIVGRSFQPASVTIEVGQPVVFVNGDDDEHTASGLGFDTGDIPPGGSATVTFDAPGTYAYVCSYHAEMRGAIEVVTAEGRGTPAAPPLATPVAVGPAVDVEIADFAFTPASLVVPPGTTVVWTNAGVAPHTVTGDLTDSGTLEPGQTFSFTFTEAGTYSYRCLFHPGMTGEVVFDPDAPPVIRGL